ncbi:MAG: tetratricopeptide repeat protein [Balneolaceae bacterium]|jgi:tetratricopeptide (TPR) repeat protein
MSHLFTRIASLVLAFGFFISCSTLQSNKTKTSASDDLSEAQIQKQLDSLNRQITSGQVTSALFYQKGELLTKLAQMKDNPANRTSFYSKSHQAFIRALEFNKNSPNIKQEKIQQLLKVSWSNEHNQGVQIMQNDSTLESSDYMTAVAHFRNATVIIPDSSISYKMEALAYYRNQQPSEAINVLEKARSNIQDIPVEILEQLAFLYTHTGQPKKAIEVYKQTKPISGQNLNLIHGLTNAYISAGEHEQAVELLQTLIKKEPDNIIYRRTLATELYSVASQKFNSITEDLENGNSIEDTEFHSADSLFTTAEKEFIQLEKENPEDLDLKQRFATFYQNGASEYQRLLPLLERKGKEQVKHRIVQYLTSSIPLLKQLTKVNPDKKEAWQNLYQAYNYLGMKDEAQHAKSNF